MSDKPKYQHDCNRCVWFGTKEHNLDSGSHISDFYICVTHVMHDGYEVTKKFVNPTVVIRHSDDGPDYASYPLSHIVEDYLNKIRHTS